MNSLDCKVRLTGTKEKPYLIAQQFYKKGLNFVVIYNPDGSLMELTVL